MTFEVAQCRCIQAIYARQLRTRCVEPKRPTSSGSMWQCKGAGQGEFDSAPPGPVSLGIVMSA